MHCTKWLVAVVRAPVSFREKETGAVWHIEACQEVRFPQRSEVGPLSAAVDRLVE